MSLIINPGTTTTGGTYNWSLVNVTSGYFGASATVGPGINLIFEKLAAGMTRLTLQCNSAGVFGTTALAIAGQYSALIQFPQSSFPKWWNIPSSAGIAVVASGAVVNPILAGAYLGTPQWSLTFNGGSSVFTLLFTAASSGTAGGGVYTTWTTSVVVPY
jgi:hypothetical protein